MIALTNSILQELHSQTQAALSELQSCSDLLKSQYRRLTEENSRLTQAVDDMKAQLQEALSVKSALEEQR